MAVSPWTPERIGKLRKLWGSGKSASQIADLLGLETRQQVIGKAYRLGLVCSTRPPKARAEKTSFFKQVKNPAVAKVAEGGSVSAFRNQIDPTPERCPKKGGEGLTILELGPHSCRWPLGKPNEPATHFCGDETVEGYSYCTEHLCRSRASGRAALPSLAWAAKVA